MWPLYLTIGLILLLIVFLFLLRRFLRGPIVSTSINTRLDGKLVVITGANTGIGKETAHDLLKRGARVIILCRDMNKANLAIQDMRKDISTAADNQIEAIKLDLASLKSIKECADQILAKEKKIDILINNAGVMHTPNWKTEDGFDMQIGTNHFGHFLLTELLLPLMKNSATDGTNYRPRIVIVSSLAHEYGHIYWDDINFHKSFSTINAYNQSKLANVLHARELSKRLETDNIGVYVLHPGVISTELTRNWAKHAIMKYFFIPIGKPFIKTPFHGAQTTIYCALEPALESHSGRYYSDCKEKMPASQALVDDDAKKLWELSEKMVGLKQ